VNHGLGEVTPQRGDVDLPVPNEFTLSPARKGHADLTLAESLGLEHPTRDLRCVAGGEPEILATGSGRCHIELVPLGQHRRHRGVVLSLPTAVAVRIWLRAMLPEGPVKVKRASSGAIGVVAE
jgi:hypothetical protein